MKSWVMKLFGNKMWSVYVKWAQVVKWSLGGGRYSSEENREGLYVGPWYHAVRA